MSNWLLAFHIGLQLKLLLVDVINSPGKQKKVIINPNWHEGGLIQSIYFYRHKMQFYRNKRFEIEKRMFHSCYTEQLDTGTCRFLPKSRSGQILPTPFRTFMNRWDLVPLKTKSITDIQFISIRYCHYCHPTEDLKNYQ